jgi:hypothetical protein
MRNLTEETRSSRAVEPQKKKKKQTGKIPEMQNHNVLGAGFDSFFRWNEGRGEKTLYGPVTKNCCY